MLLDVPLLPAPTHMCLNCDIPRNTLLGVLAACPRLRPLLLVPWQREDWDLYASEWISCAYDARFVIGLYDDYWTDWEGGARGPPDLWAQGNDFVAREAKLEWLKSGLGQGVNYMDFIKIHDD
ncbi:hypothetical protein B0H14DRAFT_3453369 [Mycena olivaceomarginata]|nr:hypothetical protein B0H14DRAFT_3453369 [Mycena olivaceomarginata]